MGFQGQLSSVNLADIFQTLHMNRQTGTLIVTGPGQSVVHIYFDNGQVAMCAAAAVEGYAFLIHSLLRKGMLQADQAKDLQHRVQATGQGVRELLLASGAVGEAEVDEIAAWCIEEVVCPIFEWSEGDFTFADGAPTSALQSVDVVSMGRGGLQTTQLLLEATRRKDEWKRIREVITDANTLYVVDNEGRANLRNIQTDAEILKVLRYLDGRHRLDDVASAVGVTRFDTFAIAAQLVLAGVARPRTPQELVADAEALRRTGELDTARGLLESVLSAANVPEVIRPLAEINAELKNAPRAVELYLELIQLAQDQGDLEQARADLDTVLTLSPDDPDLQFDRAKVLSELGHMEDAAAAYVAAAQAFLATRDTERAIDACHRAKNLVPKNPDPHRYLAKAYLMTGQTENALVEYRALWHALLTGARPRRAIEVLRETLETDCRFANIKEQVLNQALNSEAVKTSKATRVLVYVVMGLALAGAAVLGVEYWTQTLRVRGADEAVATFEAGKGERQRAGQHLDLQRDIDALRKQYGDIPRIAAHLSEISAEIAKDFENLAQRQLETAATLADGGQFDKAIATVGELKQRFPGTPAAAGADARIEALRQQQIGTQVVAVADEARRRWDADDWDGATAQLAKVLSANELPTDIRSRLTATAADWNAALRSAQRLSERAARLEQGGHLREAIAGYRRAGAAEGEPFAAQAREKQGALELRLAHDLDQAAQQAFARGDDKTAFSQLDELAALAKSAGGKVGEFAAALKIPYTVTVDSPLTRLVVKRPGAADQVIRAPAGSTSGWKQRIDYLPSESLTVEARRAGFSPVTLAIAATGRKAQATVTLSRGSLWQSELGAVATTTPVAVGKYVLLATDKATIEVVDTGLGASKPVLFPQTVDEFKSAPLIFQNLAYTVLDNRLSCVDVATRTIVWSWPPQSQPSALHLTGGLWVQEHELIPGVVLAFTGGAGGELLTWAYANGKFTAYPKIALGGDLTGALFGDQFEPNHTILYAPSGTQIAAYDTTAATEHTAATLLSTFHTRGEVVGRMARATVAGRAALLAIDASGLLVAIDDNPAAPEGKRALGSWAIEGSGTGAPVVANDTAYVAVTEGKLTAVDLARPGQLRWRFPATGAIGALSGAPALGLRGLYLADANGTLHCIDGQSGAERWHADLGAPATAGIVAAEGKVYVPLRNGTLICFEEGE